MTVPMDLERIEIVADGARLAAVGPAWTALWQKADGLIFQSHAWIAAWWRTAPDCRRARLLRIGLLWRGDRLVAVLPLSISKRKGLRLLEWAANVNSDYEDVLAAPDCPAGGIGRLWAKISALGGFDLVLLNRLLPDAKARALIAAPGPGVKLRFSHRREVSYRVCGQWASGAEWFEQQPKKTRQNYRRGRKALEEMGPLQFRLLPAGTKLGPVLERVAVLKRKWLADQQLASELFDDNATTLSGLVEALARGGVLHVFVLESAGTPIAVSINFVQQQTMMAFVTTYDPDYEKGSPGMLLMMDYIQWSIDHGLMTTDFLCGAEAFKRRFATQAVTLDTVSGSRTAKGFLAMLADRARRTVLAQWRAKATPAGRVEAAE